MNFLDSRTGKNTKSGKRSKDTNKSNLTNMIQQDTSWGSGEFSCKEVCPICGCDFVHMTVLKCLREIDETIVTSDGISIKKSANFWRGVRIIIQYSGECGHAWEVVRQFHKGGTYLRCNVLPEEEAMRGGIWRD